jgi:hypothetical protein
VTPLTVIREGMVHIDTGFACGQQGSDQRRRTSDEWWSKGVQGCGDHGDDHETRNLSYAAIFVRGPSPGVQRRHPDGAWTPGTLRSADDDDQNTFAESARSQCSKSRRCAIARPTRCWHPQGIRTSFCMLRCGRVRHNTGPFQSVDCASRWYGQLGCAC